MPEGLFTTVSDLAKAGYAGVGVIVFLLLFILLLRGKPIDSASAKLYHRFLTWGVLFAAFSGLLSVGSLLLAPKPVEQGPQRLVMTFAPDFDTEKLPIPRIKLSDGRTVGPDQEFISPGGMINISVGDALNEVRNLKATVGEYGKALAAVRDQRDALAATLSQERPTAIPDNSVAEASTASAALQSEVRSAIATGDFSRAARASKRLNAPAVIAPPAIGAMTRERQR